jgi:N-acetylmuramic acid 6-phosphate etherase
MAGQDRDLQESLDGLETEGWDADGADLDLRSTDELVELMNAQDLTVPVAVATAAPSIAAAIEEIAARLQSGGRLIYVGAGTSGRLAELDAAECEATFAARPGQVTALVAGGAGGSALEQEAAEDDAAAGERELEALGVSAADAVVAISASGRTPYVVGALAAAAAHGALTVCLVSVHDSELARLAGHEIAVPVGPEILAGSTRLKAGTSQKLVLNMISTISMIRIGKTFGNLMVDVYPANGKLEARVRRIVLLATGAPPERVDEALGAADGDAKVAIVSLLAGVDAATAKMRLAAAGGGIRQALEP